jgi:hypothetical protein
VRILETVISGAASPSCWDYVKDAGESVKAWAEAFAFASAAGFFLYKAFSGYMIANLTLCLNCERRVSRKAGVDYLVVTAVVRKGDRGAVTLHDAQARISAPAPNEKVLKKLSGIIRLSFREADGILQIQENQSQKSPLLNLSPGEETMFSTYFEVPSDRPCTVDVTLLGGWLWHGKTTYQWRASQVCLPVSRDGTNKAELFP